MDTFLLYCLKAAGCLIAFYLFYKLLLSRDTLHRLNRILLCGVLVLSLLLPVCVITIEKEIEPAPQMLPQIIPEIPLPYEEPVVAMLPEVVYVAPTEPFDWWLLAAVLYFAGVAAALGWTLWNILSVVRTISRGRQRPLGNGVVLVLTDRVAAPFSWMKYVVMSEEDYAQNGTTILVHEQTHLQLGHSWDLLVVDLLSCLQWFNPAMWLLRVELRAVHEYEADEQVLRVGVDAKDYQLLLIKKAVGGRWYSVANSLNHSNLKNRITMMLRKRSSRWARAKALYVLPLVCLALGAFAQTSYVFAEGKDMENFANGETAVLADGTEVSSPEAIDAVVELLENLRLAAVRAQSAQNKMRTLSIRVFGADDKPWAGFEFPCSGGDLKRIVTDTEGRASITTDKQVQCYIYDQGSVGGSFGFNRSDENAEIEIHLQNSIDVRYSPIGTETVTYRAWGDTVNPEDFRFDQDHLPLLMYYNQEITPEKLLEIMAEPGKKEIFASATKDPALTGRYGEKSKNGIISFSIRSYPERMRWGKPDGAATWNQDKDKLYLAWDGEISDELMEKLAADSTPAHFNERLKKSPELADIYGIEDITASANGEVYTLKFANTGDLPIDLFDTYDVKLCLLDGKEISGIVDNREDLTTRTIASMVVLNPSMAMKKYGRKARGGAIEMTSRPKSEQVALAVQEQNNKPDPFLGLSGDFKLIDGRDTYTVRNIGLRPGSTRDREHLPLVLWDDRMYDLYIFTNENLDCDIKTIQIISSPDAATIAKYGEIARNGIVKVVSKVVGREDDTQKTSYDATNRPFRYLRGTYVSVDGGNIFKVRNLKLRNLAKADPGSLPLVIVDDRIVSITDLEQIPSRKIKTIQVMSMSDSGLHDSADELVDRYGRKAYNGVIKVVTKDAAKGANPHFVVTEESDTKALQGAYATMVRTATPPATMATFPVRLFSGSIQTKSTSDWVKATALTGSKSALSRQEFEDYVEKRYGVLEIDTKTTPVPVMIMRPFSQETDAKTTKTALLQSNGVLELDLGELAKSGEMIILDGKEVSVDRIRDLDDLFQIASISVNKSPDAVDLYGEKGRRGEIRLEMKAKQPIDRRSSMTSTPAGKDEPIQLDLDRMIKSGGLFILDGNEVSTDRIHELKESEISSISVLKDQKGIERYGEKARNGVIYVTTKQGEKQIKPLKCSFALGNAYHKGSGIYRIEDVGKGFAIYPVDGSLPLVEVDGSLVDPSYLQAIDAEAVETVQVLQPSVGLIEWYGDQARDGMIKFVTKHGESLKKQIMTDHRKARRALYKQ